MITYLTVTIRISAQMMSDRMPRITLSARRRIGPARAASTDSRNA